MSRFVLKQKLSRIIGLVLLTITALLIAACSKQDAANNAPRFISPPTISLNAAPNMPLAAMVRFESDQSVIASYTISEGGDSWPVNIVNEQLDTAGAYRKIHRTTLLQLRSGRTHTVSVRIENAWGASTVYDGELSMTAPDVSVDFKLPAMQSQVQGRSNELVLLSLASRRDEDSGDSAGAINWLVAVDAQAHIVWAYQHGFDKVQLEPLANGQLRLLNNTGSSIDIDHTGNVVNVWLGGKHYAAQAIALAGVPRKILAVDGIHHRSVILPNGNHLVLAYQAQATGVLDHRKPHYVIGDAVVELTPSGERVREIPLLAVLDPARQGSEPPLAINHQLYGSAALTDWSHAVGLAYDVATDTVWLNLAHQTALVGIDYTSGKLSGIISPSNDWQLPWRQHLYSRHSAETPIKAFLSAPYVSGDGLLIGLVDQQGQYRFERLRLDNDAQQVHTDWVLPLGEQPLLASDVSPRTHTLLAGLYNADRDQVLVSQWPLPSELAASDTPFSKNRLKNTISSTPPSASFATHTNLQWHVHDVAYLPKLITANAGVRQRDASNNSGRNGISTVPTKHSAALVERSDAVDHIAADSLLGDWKVVIDAQQGPVVQTLSIDKQQPSIALGRLDGYPTIIAIKGSYLSFTVRTNGAFGTVKWAYRATVDVNQIMNGRLSLTNSQGEGLLTALKWQGSQ